MSKTEFPPAELSIVVAVYNETSYNLNALVERLEKVLTPLNFVYEIVFVNDGSKKEETSTCLKEFVQRFNYIKLVNLSRNFGQQAAITAGINFSTGKAIVSIDSDLQDPPELIPDMVRLWQRGYDVIYAKRSSRKDRLAKRFAAYLYYRLMSKVSSIEIPEDTGEFRLIDRRVAECLKQLPERTRYIRGLIPWLGFKQTTIPVDRHARHHGESTYSLKKLVALAFDGIIYFSHAPLHLLLVTGTIIILISILILSLGLTVWHHHTVLLAIVSGFVFLAGLQFLQMGIIGLYTAKIFDEVRGRPVYVISEIVGREFGTVQISRDQDSQNKDSDPVSAVDHLFEAGPFAPGYQPTSGLVVRRNPD